MQLATSACLTFILVLPFTWVSGYHYENITGAFVGVNYNPRPCMRATNNNGYNSFRWKHILSAEFDTIDMQLWSWYLNASGLCGRVDVQSFLQKSDELAVQSICRGNGLNVRGNLCISRRTFVVYHIMSQMSPEGPCIITNMSCLYHPVVVACDAISNMCLPVHYADYTGQVVGPDAQVCR